MHRQDIAAAEEAGHLHDLGTARNSLGQTLEKLGRGRAARRAYLRAFAAFRKAGDPASAAAAAYGARRAWLGIPDPDRGPHDPYDDVRWHAAARGHAAFTAALVAATVAAQLWGGPLALFASVATGVSAVLALAATAGFGCFSVGQHAGFEVAARLGVFGLVAIWLPLSVLLPVGLVVSLFLGAEHRDWAEAIGGALPVFVVLSFLQHRAVIRSNRAFDPEG